MTPYQQAQNWISKQEPAIAGAGGHDQTFHIAAALVEGFNLSIADARPLMLEYSARCQPPWTEREIDHKLESAYTKRSPGDCGKMLRKGVRWKLGTEKRTDYGLTSRPASAPQPAPKAKPAKYDVPDTTELPRPVPDGARAFLRAVFAEGEGIQIQIARTGDDGKEVPKDGGITLSREEWLRKLDDHKGNPNGFLRTGEHNGIFVRINPMKPGGNKDADVTDYRHALIEFDEISQVEQWGIIMASRIPCSAVISSGRRSIHAWVRVDAANRQEYDERVKMLYEHFSDYKPDEKNKNPSRFSRLPFCERGQGRQELLALGIGCKSWDEWAISVSDDALPLIDNAATLVNLDVPMPRELISGVLHQGCKCIIGGSSKARKTWILIDMALSVATGSQFWKWDTRGGKVLYVNFEIPRPFIRSRIASIAQARKMADISNLDVWTLRGYAAPLWKLLPEMLSHIGDSEYALIVIDPVYKTLGGRDENSAGDIGELCNEIERLAVKTGAAVVFGAHYSKGNAAAKEAMDRIGGSGVFARDADTIITLTRHNSPGAFTVDLILRNHPEQEPFVVTWRFPVMQVSTDLSARDLKQPGRTADHSADDLFELLPDGGLKSSEWEDLAKDEHGISQRTFYRLKRALEKSGRVLKSKLNGKWIPKNKA